MAKETGINPNSYLQPEVAEAYEVVGWDYGFRAAFPKYSRILPNGNVNLKTLTKADADKLAKAGFRHLRHREPKAEKPAKAEAQK